MTKKEKKPKTPILSYIQKCIKSGRQVTVAHTVRIENEEKIFVFMASDWKQRQKWLRLIILFWLLYVFFSSLLFRFSLFLPSANHCLCISVFVSMTEASHLCCKFNRRTVYSVQCTVCSVYQIKCLVRYLYSLRLVSSWYEMSRKRFGDCT